MSIRKSEKVEFSDCSTKLSNHINVWSKFGDWDILTVPSGYLYTRWGYDLTVQDWVIKTTTFVPKEVL